MNTHDATRAVELTRIEVGEPPQQCRDFVATEEPLEIRVGGRGVAVVMRTPGHDRELVAGFLLTEGILDRRDQVWDMVYCQADGKPPEENILDVILAPGVPLDMERLTRHLFTSSSCGICSKTSIEAVRANFPALRAPRPPRRAAMIPLPDRLRREQAGFASTGGLHASALFRETGELLLVREDVGRHNALDKVVGRSFLDSELPLADTILLVSGRVSFELMQKSLAAGIPTVVAISAPSSAAVDFARASGQTLVGFLRGSRMNVYAGTLAD